MINPKPAFPVILPVICQIYIGLSFFQGDWTQAYIEDTLHFIFALDNFI